MRQLIVALALGAVVVAHPALAASPSPCEAVNEKMVLRHIPLPELSIVRKQVVGGTCEVVARVMNEYVAMYVLDGYVIAGDMFNDRTHVTQQTLDDVQSRRAASMGEDLVSLVAFSYKPTGAAKGFIYMFTDPECQYCELAKYQIRDFAEKRNLEVRVILLPLAMHDGARQKAVKAVCSKMDYSGYLEGQYAGHTCKEGEEMIDRVIRTAESLEISGTPTFMSQSGKRALGYDAKRIEDIL